MLKIKKTQQTSTDPSAKYVKDFKNQTSNFVPKLVN